MTSSSTTAPAADLDGIPPGKTHDQAARLVTDHRARTQKFGETLLRPGGPNLEATIYNDGTRSRGPAAVEALASIGRWWAETLTFAEQILDLDRDQADTLARIAGDELSQVLRARMIVLGEIAADVVGSQAAAGPPVNDNGTVNVAGTPVPLSGLVAAGPPPQAAEINLSISEGAAVADVVAKIREIADAIERTGSYS